MILSLVYAGGAILASKRSPYEDLIAEGFNEEVLAERLKRQHRLICAAILAGRVEDLKRLGTRDATPAAPVPAVPVSSADKIIVQEESPAAVPVEVPEDRPAKPLEAKPVKEQPYSVHDPRRQSGASRHQSRAGLCVSLLEEPEFRSGDALTLGILVTHKTGDEETPLSGVSVSVKVLGTTFRPVILSLRTQRDGVAIISTQIPQFTSGRAAMLIRANKEGDTVEIRRVIHPSR